MTVKTNSTNGPLTIGLDIGIASVGWAVLEPGRIVDMGVRCFDAAEDKDGKPHNQTRRGARVARNRYHQRTWRLKKLARMFRDIGMLTNNEIKHLFSANHEKNVKHVRPWRLRAEGLSRKLNNTEWAQVIYHIVKHRGFKFFSKAEDPTNISLEDENSASEKSAEKAERDGLRHGLEYTGTLLKKYPQFTHKTLGYVVYQLAHARQDKDDIYRDSDGNELDKRDCEEFQNSYRNKDKSYKHAFRRDDLIAELNVLFKAQQYHGNPFTNCSLPDGAEWPSEVIISSETRPVDTTFRAQVFALLELQHPPITSNQMDALIGDCELENEARNGTGKAERRAAKHSFSNERATWLQTINNLRIKRNGKSADPLTADERALLINFPYTQTKVTFKQVREKLREAFSFPTHWREASFTKVSYRSNRKNDGSWINVIAADGARTSLGKYGEEGVRKSANKKLKEGLDTGTMTFAELRQLFGLKDGEAFEHVRKDDEFILPSLEAAYPIPFESLDNKEAFIKRLPAKSKKSLAFKAKEMTVLSTLRNENPVATLADLRAALEGIDRLEAGWQFEVNQKAFKPIKPEDESTTPIPIEYEDAQKAEEETLIELRGWHAFKRALETTHPEWWMTLQAAYINPQSEAGQLAARQLDAIAELLTKAQTDADVEKGLAELNLTESQIRTLAQVRFKQYKNLSLTALRKILPSLEAGKNYTEACNEAGYKLLTHQRTKHLPPLETYLYERIRHGKKTKYTELRYKDLTNPVVARAFNQARLVLNALIDRYDKSPAYVHVELARDIARPLKGHRNAQGKYIEGRLDIQKKQEENRNKRESIRKRFIETHNVNEPTARQILKERLYHEQQCKCVYTLEKLDLDRVVRDESYAQLDHIWPRSLTFDNSMENLALVHAHANQDKGHRIPYDFITHHPNFGTEHWRKVEKYILSCKGISDNKQKRLLAKELDADEFSARNLVDTRYATRLFARMVRDRLLFDGQVEDKTEDIDPSESGKTRLEKFHKTRVRTPQGGVTAFLRRGWLGDVKDRAAGDKHHALDACIVAACSQKIINDINSYFANEEKVPSRFKKHTDGTYTDRGTPTEQGAGEIISKQEARARGLYLSPPWARFRAEFFEKYKSVFVSRAIRKKRNVELHDSNPMRLRYYPVSLQDLTLDMLDEKQLPPNLSDDRMLLIQAIRHQLLSSDGDASIAFPNGFLTKNEKGKDKTVHSVPLPLVSLPKDYLGRIKQQLAASGSNENFTDTAKKNVPLNKLSLKTLSEKELGTAFHHRNRRVIEALTAQLKKFDDDADKAFAEKFYPFGMDRPFINSIRLPAPRGSGIYVRGGVANLGEALYTEMYKHEGVYWFRARYKVPQEDAFGLPVMPKGAQHICNFAKNELIRIKHSNLAHCYHETSRFVNTLGNTLITVESVFDNGIFEGYWNYFEPSNDRPVVQMHDGSAFFLLEDGKALDKKTLVLIAKPKQKKKAKGQEEMDYFEFCDDTQGIPPLKFSLVNDIKRNVRDAIFIEKAKVNILGCFQEG